MDFLQNISEQKRPMVTKILNMEGQPVAQKLELLRKIDLDPGSIAPIEEFLRESPGGENPVDPLQTPEPTENELEIQINAEKKSRFFDGFPKEINILLLGREGSGKAEFINSFANYLKYENFDQPLVIPERVSVMNVIPTFQFSSETKKAQVYSFTADGAQKSLRFIDTPDLILDPRDLDCIDNQDDHLRNVLELVKNFGQIHAILIFVRSDEEHIISYTSYLREAFQKVHYQASKNIIFCFTSIANTSYRPRESAIKDFADWPFPPSFLLSQWPFNFKAGHEVRVAENNTFCFENDSYRLLCAQKEGVPLSENAISLCQKHWTLSAQETFRLLGHIKTLTPFSNSTLNTIFELMPVLSDFFVSRIVQIVDADEEIRKPEKGSIQQGGNTEELRTLKKRSDEFKISFPKLVDFCVKLDTYVQQNVLAYNGFFVKHLLDSFQKKLYTVEVQSDPSRKDMFKTYFRREMEHFWKERRISYMNNLLETVNQITLEEITAKELPAIERYFAEESKEWKRILTKQQILSRPHSAELIKIENDWYCNSHIWK